jgi:HEAT repeat protein
MAARALGGLASTESFAPLVGLLSDSDSRVRAIAAQSIGALHDKRAAELLLPLLEDESPEVVCSALAGLAQTQSERAFAPAVARLFDTNDDIRRNAAAAAGSLKDPRAYEPLRLCLDDEDERVRANAAWALGQIAEPAALEDLRVKTDSDDSDAVRANAVDALVSLAAAPCAASRPGDALSGAASRPDDALSGAAAFALGVAADGDESPLVRAAALLALAKRPGCLPAEALARLQKLSRLIAAGEADDDLRSSAVWTLGRLLDGFPRPSDLPRPTAFPAFPEGPPDLAGTLETLRAALDDPYEWCARYAKEALESQGSC